MEQSKWRKTKIVLGTIAAATAGVIAVPLAWTGYMYSKTTKIAFSHPWLTAGLLAGGIAYAAHGDSINEHITEYVSGAQEKYTTYKFESLNETIEQLQNENDALRKGCAFKDKTLEAIVDNDELLFGLGLGAGGSALGFGAYALLRPRKKIFVVKH